MNSSRDIKDIISHLMYVCLQIILHSRNIFNSTDSVPPIRDIVPQMYDFGIAKASLEAKHQSSVMKAGPREMKKSKIPSTTKAQSPDLNYHQLVNK